MKKQVNTNLQKKQVKSNQQTIPKTTQKVSQNNVQPKSSKTIKINSTKKPKKVIKKQDNNNKQGNNKQDGQEEQKQQDETKQQQDEQQIQLQKQQQEAAIQLLNLQKEKEQEENQNIVFGNIKLKYHHYIEEFQIKNQKLKKWIIDEKFEISKSYQGNYQIKITIPPLTQKSVFLELSSEEEEFQNLEDGQTYMLLVQEDQLQSEKDFNKLKLYKQINLVDMLSTIQCIKDMDKSAIIIEQETKTGQFFKYKDNVIDITDMKMKEQLQQQTREESQEQARQQIIWAMRSGCKCVILMEKQIHNLNKFFEGCKFYQPDKLFIPSQYARPEYYKDILLYNESEDVDYVGVKGQFKPRDDFSINICYFDNDKNVKINLKIDEFQEKTQFNSNQFKVIFIDPDQQTNKQIYKENSKCPIMVQKNHTDLLDLVEQAYTVKKQK